MVFLFLFSAPAFAADLGALSREPVWRRLLHAGLEVDTKSSAENLFLSPEGRNDPESELRATLEAFRAPVSSPDDHALCRYPARAKVLRRLKPGIDEDWPKISCPRFERWKSAIHAVGMELVFASAFVNSPSSMYGHTMLKFVRGGKTEGQELLDYVLSFGADTGGVGGLSYIVMGLTGAFPGYFATSPFYLKVHEYENVENRDFWVYPIRLTPEQLELLVDHAWELKGVRFPYYFLKKNCSYYLLDYLELAFPESDLKSGFPLWAIPADTIRALQGKSLLGNPEFRPSRERKMLARRSMLRGGEEVEAKNHAEGKGRALKDPVRAPLVLDAAYELFRFRHATGQNLNEEEKKTEDALLKARGEYAAAPLALTWKETPPEKAHRTQRVGLAVGGLSRGGERRFFSEFRYRPALHDLLQPSDGYEPGSELSMGDTRFRAEKRFFLERFDLIRIRSVSPRDSWVPKVAWNFLLGSSREKVIPCEGWHCTLYRLQGGAGLSQSLGSGLYFIYLDATQDFGSVLSRHFRLAIGPEGGLFLPLGKGFRLLLEGGREWSVWGEGEGFLHGKASVSYSVGTDAGLRFEASSYDKGLKDLGLAFEHSF